MSVVYSPPLINAYHKGVPVEPNVSTRLATLQDVDTLASLERQYLNDELTSAGQGLQGQAFTAQALQQLVQQHWIVVAEIQGRIIGYVIAGRWDFFSTGPLYRAMLTRLHQLTWDGPRLTQANTCQYGPIWLHPAYRGSGIFELLVAAIKRVVNPHFAFMLTCIAENNERSFAAHSGKAHMQVVDFFTVSARDYYLMAAKTQA